MTGKRVRKRLSSTMARNSSLPHGAEQLGFEAVGAARDLAGAGLEVEVVAAVGRLLAPGVDVSPHVALVGRLVGREARVAIDAVGAVAHGERGHGGIHLGQSADEVGREVLEGGARLVVFRPVGSHPFAVVMHRYPRKEAEHERRTFVFCHISQV